MRYSRILAVTGAVLLASAASHAAGIANPAAMVPTGRIYIGASYHLGGYTVTNEELGMVTNRFHARVGYSPLDYLNFGIDLGASQVDVDSVTITTATDTTHFISFQGKYGFSGGINVKGATPRFFNDMMSVIGIANATIFSSENDDGAAYGGIDIDGVLGLQFKIPKFGYVSAGAKLYYIQGSNKSYDSKTEHDYSNTDNLQGWIALDFVPSFKGGNVKGKPYFSAEVALTPSVSTGGSVPLQGIAFTFSVGWVSPRLYGEDFENVD